LYPSLCSYELLDLQHTKFEVDGLPIQNIVGFGLQQDAQIHTSTDHLGRSFHQAALKQKEYEHMTRCSQDVKGGTGHRNELGLLSLPHLNTFGTPSKLRSSPSFPSRASTPFRISLGSTGPPAMSETHTTNNECTHQQEMFCDIGNSSAFSGTVCLPDSNGCSTLLCRN